MLLCHAMADVFLLIFCSELLPQPPEEEAARIFFAIICRFRRFAGYFFDDASCFAPLLPTYILLKILPLIFCRRYAAIMPFFLHAIHAVSCTLIRFRRHIISVLMPFELPRLPPMIFRFTPGYAFTRHFLQDFTMHLLLRGDYHSRHDIISTLSRDDEFFHIAIESLLLTLLCAALRYALRFMVLSSLPLP